MGHFRSGFPMLYFFVHTFSRKVSLSPFDIPAGIYTYSVTFEMLIPVALHSLQGLLMTSPMPLHRVHSKCITIEFCRYIVVPDPPQARQRVGTVPGSARLPPQDLQVPFLSNSSFCLTPLTESRKLMVIYLAISSPLRLRVEPVE